MTADDLLNEDWIKTQSWDMGFDVLDGLWAFLGGESRADLEKFMALPAWQAAPQRLKDEAGAWLLRNP
jgi:hypothetical protein